MRGILKAAGNFFLKIVYFKLQYVMTFYQWTLRFSRLRLRGWKSCGLRKDLDRALKDLGSEVYALHGNDAQSLQNAPSVKQKLKIVQEAENRLMAAEDSAQGINEDYAEKTGQIKEKYTEKRARIGADAE